MENHMFYFYPYLSIIVILAILGTVQYFLFSKVERKRKTNILLVSSLVLVAFYENLALMMRYLSLSNHWVFNIFFFHVATWINLFLVKEFIVSHKFRKMITVFAWILLIFSAIPYAFGFFPFNDMSSFSAFLSDSLIIITCGLFFYDLLSNDAYLDLNILHFSGFWIATALLFFYSVNFILFFLLSYMIGNHMNIFIILVKLPMISGIVVYSTFFLALIKWKAFKVGTI